MSDAGALRLVSSTPETEPRTGDVPAVGVAAGLTPYLPSVALQWLADTPQDRHRRVEGTLLFVDVSGFTTLTERLAARGKVGAEEITDVVGGVFGELLGVAFSYGADLLKWGGDAVLLHFPEPDSASRAGRASVLMIRKMRRIGSIRTSAGRITLKISIGAHRGTFDLYMLGDRHRELMITGPEATTTAQMEGLAEAGQIVVSAETARGLDAGILGDPKGDGVLLAGAPDADRVLSVAAPVLGDAEVASLVPADRRLRLLGGGEQAEHRQATVGFLEFSGIDALTRAGGGELVAANLDPVVCATQAAAERNGVNFHETDIGPDGGKIVLLGGVPLVRGRDAERLLRTVYEVIRAHPPDSPVVLRGGVNTGRVFVFSHNFELSNRRVFAVTGDAVNLAARVMGKAGRGMVVATEAALIAGRNAFEVELLPPFRVKGKTEPVLAAALVRPRSAEPSEVGEGLPFTGREMELEQVLGRAEVAASGSGGIVEIAGPPGIGKSRLVSEAIERWKLDTSRVGCEEYHSATPYRPFRRILRRLLGVADDAPSEVAAADLRRAVIERVPHLESSIPLLADVVDVSVPPTREVEELEQRFRRPRLEFCVVELLRTYLSTPSALVFEDVQVIDEASSSLIVRLADELARLPVLVVLTRQVDSRTVVPSGEVPLLALELAPLPEEAASRLAATGGGPALSPAQISAIVERADGNPLFLHELLRSAGEAGGVEALPESLEPLLVAQIDRLSASDRQVLRAAAVLGVSFDPVDVGQVLDFAAPVSEEVWSRLDAFVAPTATGWRFAHGLMRDAAYEGLSFKRRRELHGRAAQAIESRLLDPNEAADLLSLHWMSAEEFDHAWRYARLAGDRARALWANADAATLYARALLAAGHLSLPRSEVASVAEALGDAWELAADYPRARRAYSHARRYLDGDVGRAQLLRKMGVLHERQGRYRQALTCYTRGRHLLSGRSRADSLERSELDLASAGIKSRQGRFADCARLAAEAAREASRARHRSGLAHALYLQHKMSVYFGDPDDSLGSRSVAIFEELGDLIGQANALNNLGLSAYYRGQWDAALDYWERSRVMRLRAGDVVGAATEENNLAEIYSDQGRYGEARALFESAHATWHAAGYPLGVALATSNLGRLEARSGSVASGRQLLERALEAFLEIKAANFIAETRLRLGECDVLDGDFHAGVACAHAVLTDARSQRGSEQTEVAALRLLGTAAGFDDLTGHGSGSDAARLSLDKTVDVATSMDARYELALALSSRALFGRLGADRSPGAKVDDQWAADRRRAEEIFARLGVKSAVLTWSSDVTGYPIFAAGTLHTR